jgi:hypothetical protein
LIYAYQSLAQLYSLQHKEDSVQSYLYKAEIILKKFKTDEQIATYISLYNQQAEYFINKNKMDSAKLYLEHADNLMQKNKFPYTNHTEQCYGDYYLKQKDTILAVSYYKKALANTQALGLSVAEQDLHSILYKLYKGKDSQKYTEHLEIFNKLRDQANSTNSTIYSNILEYLLKVEQQKHSKFMLQVGTILVLVVLSGLAYLFYIGRINRIFKSRLRNKKEIIIQIEDEIQKLENKNDINNFEKVLELARSNNPCFLASFNRLYPEFSENLILINPQIKTADILFCAYLKLQFTTKEIAAYTFTSPKTVQNRKNAIRKKIYIPSDEDIYIWINDLG